MSMMNMNMSMMNMIDQEHEQNDHEHKHIDHAHTNWHLYICFTHTHQHIRTSSVQRTWWADETEFARHTSQCSMDSALRVACVTLQIVHGTSQNNAYHVTVQNRTRHKGIPPAPQPRYVPSPKLYRTQLCTKSGQKCTWGRRLVANSLKVFACYEIRTGPQATDQAGSRWGGPGTTIPPN
eukprot:718257-Rhodomonas_salina.1